jgi:hypothetical protein
LKNFAILVDSQNVSAVETQAKPIAAVAKQRGIQVLYLDVKNPENAKAELAELVSSAVTTMRKSDPSLDDSLFWITGSTSVFKEIATINSSRIACRSSAWCRGTGRRQQRRHVDRHQPKAMRIWPQSTAPIVPEPEGRRTAGRHRLAA